VAAGISARISAYQIALAANQPSTKRVGPFYARFDTGLNPYNNYAIPEPGAEPSADDVTALVRAYQETGRQPRLEYVAASAPAVEPSLTAQGFVTEDRPALMACEGGKQQRLVPPPGISLLKPSSDEDLLAMVAVQREAFDDPTPPGPDELAGQHRNLERGCIFVLARDDSTGDAAGAGVCTPLERGVTEIAGIGVRPRFRRRGIAAALTARLAADAFTQGATLAWLTPGGEEAQRIYARAGFQAIGELLMISLPAAAAS
jgi:predicted GNAT family acetyltransferase